MINLITNIGKAIWTVLNGRQNVTLQANNMYTSGYNLQTILSINGYGDYALPNTNTNAVLIPINGSTKAMTCIGYIQSLPTNSPIVLVQGESARASNNWAICWHNYGLNAYKLDNLAYSATLPSGEWINYLMLNRIDELTNIINEQNTNITNLIAWAANVTTATGVSPLVQAVLPVPATLAQDTTYINHGNDLLNNNAIVVP